MNRGASFYRNMFLLALPIILQNLIMTSLGMVDTFMVGLLGEASMAAVTVANTPIFVVQLIIFGLQSGAAVLISQYWGKGDTEAISRLIGIGLYIASFISIIFALVMYLIPTQFMSLFSNNPELIEISADYSRIVGFSYIFNCLTGVYVGAHRGMENPKMGLIIFSISMVLNTFLNWVLIFGKFGAPAMGVEGAALATLISRIVEFFVAVFYAKFNKIFKLNLKLALAPGRLMVAKYVKYATPVVLNETIWGLGTALYPTIMGHMDNSKEILAAYTIAGNLDKLCTVTAFAIAATAAVIIGREIGRGASKENVFDVGSALITVAMLSGAVIGGIMLIILYFFIEPYVYPIFGLSELSSDIASMMQVSTFVFLSLRSFNATNVVGILRGGGDVRSAAMIDTMPLWLVSLPMAAICGLVLELSAFWVIAAMATERIVKFFFGFARYRSKKWINDVTQQRV